MRFDESGKQELPGNSGCTRRFGSSVCSSSAYVAVSSGRYEDAADRPDVDLRVVVLLKENEFWRAVPARHHVLRQLSLHAGGTVAPHACASHVTLRRRRWSEDYLGLLLFLVLQIHLAGETEVDDLQLALCVDEDVGGLQVAVHDVRALHVQESAEKLIDDELDVLGPPSRDPLVVLHHAREVPATILLDRPQILERARIWRNEHVSGMRPFQKANSSLQMFGWSH